MNGHKSHRVKLKTKRKTKNAYLFFCLLLCPLCIEDSWGINAIYYIYRLIKVVLESRRVKLSSDSVSKRQHL